MADMKFVMFGVTFVLVLIGGTMLGVGIWMSVDSDAQEEAFMNRGLNEDLYWTSVYLMITIGCLVLIAAFLGMFGAASPKKHKFALFGFMGILCLALILELIVIILTGIFWDSIDADIGTQTEGVRQIQDDYVSETSQDNVSVYWNTVQMDYKCCGSRDFNDYDASEYKMKTGNEVPWTCCVMEVDGGNTLEQVLNYDACKLDASQVEIIDRSDYLHYRGCYSRLNDVLEENSIILIALTVAFAALEVVGLVIAFLLIRDD